MAFRYYSADKSRQTERNPGISKNSISHYVVLEKKTVEFIFVIGDYALHSAIDLLDLFKKFLEVGAGWFDLCTKNDLY